MRKKLLLIMLAITVAFILSSCDLFAQIFPPDTDGPSNNDSNKNEEITVKSIALYEAKTEFAFGENFSYDDLAVIATMSDNSEQLLTSDDYTVVCEDFDSMKIGTYQVSVKLKDAEVFENYSVTVSPANRLKVLMIGNSYADDTINYAYEIAKNAGIPAEQIFIADIYIGGCTLETHWSNARSNATAYRFGLEGEGYFDGKSYNNWTMEQAIKYTDWDFITLQQGSAVSGMPTSYACLQDLMDYILDVATDTESNPNANPDVKLVWHQTWAYAQNSGNSGFASYAKDQMTMYNSIVSCVKSKIISKDFAAVIPNGTAIQNARTSFIGDNLTRDDYDHLSEDAGRYIAALGLVGTLTGRDMAKVTWKPSDSGFAFTMSDEMIAVCKESYTNAIKNPYSVTKSEYAPKGMFDDFEGSGTKNDPYLIQSADDMWNLSNVTAGQNVGDGNLYFKLTADIDLSSESWKPICSSAEAGWVETAKSFNGNFDGNGKTITFVGNYTGDSWAKGLFSAVGGHVHDLTLRGTINTEKGRVGSLASMAMAGAKIENVISYVNITAGNNQAGGIIGYIAAPDVKIINCENYGTITGRELVGGIVGGSWQNVSFSECKNHGEVTATLNGAGGIVSEKYASATLTNCSNDGKVVGGGVAATNDIGSSNNYAGYLVGREY
ncbi:MAG: DUF4886 domain-containing protein [Clostridia bacterium]|nr:DUF4886 domain-containing protein [Clostridia bacterium]